MEERENYQTDDHCSMALNVDFSRGYIEAREGFSRHIATTSDRANLHVVKQNGKEKFILIVGVDSNNNPRFEAYDLETKTLGSAQELSSLGESINNQGFKCSFVDTILTRDEDGDGNRESPHHVTLVTTKSSTYIFDPKSDKTKLQKFDGSKDVIRVNSINWGYWTTVPRGCISAEHKSMIFYAGFEEGFTVGLTSPMDELQQYIPEALFMFQDRSTFQLGPQFFAWSDPFDPFGIAAYHFMGVDENEKITALKSFKEQLVVFTEKSIYIMSGATDETYELFKVVEGPGCISHNSVVEVAGALYYMAKDGVYMFVSEGPEGAVQKLSKPIDSLFTGKHTSTYVGSEKARNLLVGVGYPFHADMQTMDRCNGLHVQSRNQIWWSVNQIGSFSGTEIWGLTIVYDYVHQAWSIYATNVLANGNKMSCMYDGVVVSGGKKEEVYTSTSGVTNGLLKYGSIGDDDGSTAERSVPMLYITGRLLKENERVMTFRPVRLKMLSWGKKQSSDPAKWFVEGEEAHADFYYKDANGNFQESTDRQFTEGTVDLHPAEDMHFFYNDAGTYLTDGGANTDLKYQDVDWFTSKLENGSVKSRTIRVGLMSGYGDAVRSGELIVQGLLIDSDAGDSR
tara:strand:+ start:12045 stop:13916 length:1872 start_codon:yes stop_codon:yes gene_type:complete